MNNQQLSVSARVNRIVVGTGLIIFTLVIPFAPLGLLALIPLLATYPIFAGIYGYDPVSQWTVKEFHAVLRSSEHVIKSGHTPKHS